MPSWHAAKSWSARLPARSTTLPRQQLADALHRMIGKAGEDSGEPSLRVDAVELGGLDQRVNGGGAPSAFIGAGKGPVGSSDGDAAQRSFGGVVRDAQTAIGEEASERRPKFEAVVDCLGCLALSRGLAALRAQPSLKLRDQRPAALIAHREALLWHHAVDLALDGEQSIDAFDCRDCDWRLLQPCQVEKLAPRMRPACVRVSPGKEEDM